MDLDADDEAAYAAFAADRLWNGYSIADLESPFRAYARIAVARARAGAPHAACLFLRHPSFSSIIPTGDPAALAAILAAADLPEAAFLLARSLHLPVLERYFTFGDSHSMLRLSVNRQTFRPPEHREAVERLSLDDLPALLDLYAGYNGNAFNPDQLRSGPFHGVRQGGALLAVGGIHALSARHRIGAVGNFFTRPEARGRGYGTAIAGAVVRELLAGPCQDVILNVAADNAVARRLYHRLGFGTHCDYFEGRVLRKGGFG